MEWLQRGQRSDEKISKNVDFSLWGNRATTRINIIEKKLTFLFMFFEIGPSPAGIKEYLPTIFPSSFRIYLEFPYWQTKVSSV